MAAFPALEVLAAASLDEVRVKWQGLGYYSRACRLHEVRSCWLMRLGPAAGAGMSLPGIGRTTAGSILSSAFNSVAYPGWQRQTVLALDGPSTPASPRRRPFWS